MAGAVVDEAGALGLALLAELEVWLTVISTTPFEAVL
jgi:hypothetical protein